MIPVEPDEDQAELFPIDKDMHEGKDNEDKKTIPGSHSKGAPPRGPATYASNPKAEAFMKRKDAKTILLVEDEAIIAMMEKTQLEKYGYQVHHAPSGREAIQTIASGTEAIDLILMDINLGPGIDGTQTAEEILRQKDIPIIFLSSHTEPEIVEKTENISSYGYVVKNSSITVLDASIKMAFKLYEAKISEQNKEKNLREKDRQFRKLSENVPDLFYQFTRRLDGSYCVPIASAGIKNVFGCRPEDVVEDFAPIARVLYPEDAERVIRDIEYSAEHVSYFTCEFRVQIPGKPLQWILSRAAPEKLEDGSITWYGFNTIITERKLAEEALKRSEATVRNKLRAIIEPEGDIGALELADIIDAPVLQSLLEDFYRATGMLGAILDISGKVLVAVGWQDICTQFHRCNPETLQNCIESDTVLTQGVPPGTFKAYRCKNNMWDMVTPLMIGNRHVGNVFIGQFLYEGESPDIELFREQARRYGFDEAEYLAALAKVPRFSRETAQAGMQFYAKLAALISKLSFSAIQQSRLLTERNQAQEEIKRQLSEKETLLHEVHHRIKNNIASIESLLTLQAASTESAEVKTALQESISRIQSTQVLYEALLISKDYREVSIKAYIESLIDSLVAVFTEGAGVTIRKQISDFTISSQKAISIGMIVNELMTNVFKYAFKDRTDNIVSIELTKTGNRVALSIKDNGIGIDPRIEAGKAPGFGLTIIKMLAEQLEGSYTIERDAGTRTVFEFAI